MADHFSHIDEQNNPSMVNVGEKKISARIAHAQATIFLGEQIMKLLLDGELNLKKGPVFQTAILAGIMGAKKTSELIPLCHPIGLDDCKIEIYPIDSERVRVKCITALNAKTGVEMEALTGASVAALTIYDMCKAMSHDIRIEHVILMEKKGGKRDFKRET
jgi:cyclic pyranopterin phosphate synthase